MRCVLCACHNLVFMFCQRLCLHTTLLLINILYSAGNWSVLFRENPIVFLNSSDQRRKLHSKDLLFKEIYGNTV